MEITTALQQWFSINKRSLPWRNTRDPYKIWLSEIILQQTQVAQGWSYYENFIHDYPTIHKLAAASEHQILRSWQGLGYYSRARNLHTTAKYISEELKGVFPKKHKSLLDLKGVGPYTAAAIASIAFNEPVAAVDGNVYRVLARIFDISLPINSGAGKKIFQQLADQILDWKNSGNHNQAVMELGALVCTPAKPDCQNCPLRPNCLAYKNNTIDKRPVKLKKAKAVLRQLNYMVLFNDDEFLFKKRGAGDIWQGLHDFPELGSSASSADKQLLAQLTEHGLSPENCTISEPAEVYAHQLSHQKISARFWQVKTNQVFQRNSLYLPINKNELETIPIPRLIEKYIQKELVHP